MSLRNRWLVAAALLLALFALDAWWALIGWSDRVDHFALVWLRDPGDARTLIVPQWTLKLALTITAVGGAAIRAPAAVIGAIILYVAGRRREALAFTMAVASAALALPLIKLAGGRARPDLIWQLVTERKMSFPSGHAFGAAVTFPLMGYLSGRRFLAIAGLILALLIGLSRVFLGVHWLSDVIGGWLLGGAWACAAIAFLACPEPSRRIGHDGMAPKL